MTEQEQKSMVQVEASEYERLKRMAERVEKREKQREERTMYRDLVDGIIDDCYPGLVHLSKDMTETKRRTMEEFRAAIEAKAEMFGLKRDSQRSHTFTHSDGSKRITIGVRTTDGYHDTAQDGEQMIREELEKLGRDDESKSMVRTILRLLAKDKNGSLRANKVVELRQLAEEIDNERIQEGVRIITEAYISSVTKAYISVEHRLDSYGWVRVPLSVTEAPDECDVEHLISGKGVVSEGEESGKEVCDEK